MEKQALNQKLDNRVEKASNIRKQIADLSKEKQVLTMELQRADL